MAATGITNRIIIKMRSVITNIAGYQLLRTSTTIITRISLTTSATVTCTVYSTVLQVLYNSYFENKAVIARITVIKTRAVIVVYRPSLLVLAFLLAET